MNRDNQQDTCCEAAQSEPMSMSPKKHLKFNECDIEEKVARLHAEVVGLRQSLRWSHESQSRMATKLFSLEHHQHSSNGSCMLRIEDVNRGDNDKMAGGLCASIDYLA